MADGGRVLVVDGLTETEEVLRAILEPRGWEVARWRSCETPAAIADPRPQVLVIHRDDRRAAECTGGAWDCVPRVVIGSGRLPEGRRKSRELFLRQPFHYPELIQAVEHLLSEASGDQQRSAA